MDSLATKINDQIRQRPLMAVLVVFVIGVLLGWMALGWGLFPVRYVDGEIHQLRADLKQDYVRLAAAAYVLDGDIELAQQRIGRLGADSGNQVQSALEASLGDDAIRIAQLQFVLQSTSDLLPPAGGGEPAPAPSLMTTLRPWLLACGLILVVAVVGGFLFLRLRGGMAAGRRAPRPRDAADLADGGAAEAAMDYGTPAPTPTGEPPVARFMTTYTLGDDVYDDSFSVDGPDGSFLGECGMGISETIGVGDPKKVTAFEVWLFDKNDIRTVTKVVMSEHAFRDEALKSRLSAKGEPVQASAGDTIQLETATLVVMARVVDMAYGGGALPQNSFFERITIELAAFRKPAAV